ncbi:hypothetical protein K32_43290 [Kaistia sp. 32K]|uniref:porin n=1 Tax=Kaistia sp. 32K TaxID=2795690 RepID=UPI00191566AF|nr:porin [Kaistia sp. 32K]BCP55712.1 hypothetical protein K32_43290 [Kaistia sp. 32K]
MIPEPSIPDFPSAPALVGRSRFAQPALWAALTLFGAGAAEAEGFRLDAPPVDPPSRRERSAAPEPKEAEDSSYARICEAFGEGFTYSPATGVCIKIGGYVKFGTSFGRGSGAGTRPGTQAFELR